MNAKRFLPVFLLLWNCAAFAAPPDAAWFPKPSALPKPTGQVIHVRSVKELIDALNQVQPGVTILVANGFYRMPQYVEITADNVTLRGASGHRDDVILDAASSRHGELLGVRGCTGVTIADLTVQNVKWNGIKINSDRGAQRVTIHNCVLHNVWQRGVKAPAVPKEKEDTLSPRDCRVQYCLFYNDRPKRFSDDQTDTPQTYNGNYIGGIDVKNTVNWRITDNVFVGIQGRTREGRGCIYISENGRGCVIERNVFINCDIGIALGNPTLGYSPLQAIDCTVRDNFVTDCPETGILACYTQNCLITKNTIHDPQSPRGRLIWAQKSDEGLAVTNNLVIGPPIQVTSTSVIDQRGNVVRGSVDEAAGEVAKGVGQSRLTLPQMRDAIEMPARLKAARFWTDKQLLAAGVQSDECITAMQKLHAGFKGQRGYVAQFGDSITYSLAFWAPIGWDEPQQYIALDDGLPKTPEKVRWRDFVKGTRDKGPDHANYSGWTVGQLPGAVDAALKRDQPEVAIVMIGTNDIAGGRVPATYGDNLTQVVQKCLAAHCIPILNTIPPRRDRDDAVGQVNDIIRAVARKHRVPLVDFYAECLRLRPGQSWDGTIIGDDGVHPTGGDSNVYTEDNMRVCGYALRNWVNFLALRQVYFRVLADDAGDK
jgi:lysophospholipase L1-like esterase